MAGMPSGIMEAFFGRTDERRLAVSDCRLQLGSSADFLSERRPNAGHKHYSAISKIHGVDDFESIPLGIPELGGSQLRIKNVDLSDTDFLVVLAFGQNACWLIFGRKNFRHRFNRSSGIRVFDAQRCGHIPSADHRRGWLLGHGIRRELKW